MTATMQQVKSAKNPPETIIDNSAKTPFLSPLQQFIMNNCQHCALHKVNCRLEDSRGLTPMSLCIMLFTGQPPDFSELLKAGALSEKTLQEAKTEQEASEDLGNA
jgi:hypothetical protein